MTRSLHFKSLSLVALATAAALAAPIARADGATPDYPTVSTSTVTRAQVQADLVQARLDGSIRNWSTSYSQAANSKSIASRAQVRAELRADHAQVGGVNSSDLAGEDSGSFPISRALPLAQPVTLAGTR